MAKVNLQESRQYKSFQQSPCTGIFLCAARRRAMVWKCADKPIAAKTSVRDSLLIPPYGRCLERGRSSVWASGFRVAEGGEALTWKNRVLRGTVANFHDVEKVLLGNLVHPLADCDSVPELYSLELLVWFLNESSDETSVFPLERKQKRSHREERPVST